MYSYMSTQREVLEGQTVSHRAKRANFGRGSGGPPPENVKHLYCKWYNLRYSWAIFVNIISLYCNKTRPTFQLSNLGPWVRVVVEP